MDTTLEFLDKMWREEPLVIDMPMYSTKIEMGITTLSTMLFPRFLGELEDSSLQTLIYPNSLY
jgi:hypothetical protein